MSDAGVKTADDLFALIGYGTLSAKQLLGKLVPADRLKEKAPDGVVAAAVKRAFGGGEEKSKCAARTTCWCSARAAAIRSAARKIVGYITRGKGVSVHSATCPNVVNLLYDPERRIEVEWDKSSSADARYTVKLTMEVEDRKGLLAAVSAKIADINTNIKNMEARTGEDQHARIDMTIEISDLKHLEGHQVVAAVKGVLDVERTAGSRHENQTTPPSWSAIFGFTLDVVARDGVDFDPGVARQTSRPERSSVPEMAPRRTCGRRRSWPESRPCRRGRRLCGPRADGTTRRPRGAPRCSGAPARLEWRCLTWTRLPVAGSKGTWLETKKELPSSERR